MRTCDSCGTELKQVSPDIPARRHDDSPNYYGSLRIYMRGGYGEYIDSPIFGPWDDIRICKTCADVLMSDNPWLKNIVDPNPLEGKNAPR